MTQIENKNKKIILIGLSIAIIVIAIGVGGFCWWKICNDNVMSGENNNVDRDVKVVGDNEGITYDEGDHEGAPLQTVELSISAISGIRSENGNRRPFAVMLAGDETVRPLAGIGQADLVVEMPVIENGINRMMAVYVSENPKDIGSVRSARHDFIPLAKGLGAIFVHWGGSHFALDELDKGVIDHLDAVVNLHNTFYRKKGIARPNNGFTTMDRMVNSSEKLGYDIFIVGEPAFAKSYGQSKKSYGEASIISEKDWDPDVDGWEYLGTDIKINYPGKFGVEWKFNSLNKLYYRFRGGTAEIDKNTGKQVTATAIAVLKADSRHLEGQYNDIDIEGSGKLTIYQQGYILKGEWEKDKDDQSSPMKFLNLYGNEIQLIAGQKWWEIISYQLTVSS